MSAVSRLLRGLRADQVVGAVMAALALAVIAMSWNLPFGTLDYPGPSMIPMSLATALLVFGLLAIARPRRDMTLADIDWHELQHAVLVLLGLALAALLFTRLGFLLTLSLLILGYLVLLEREPLVPSTVYAVTLPLLTWLLFTRVLAIPLPRGILAF